MLYFAYGSNMDFTQMRERCPSAQFVAVAALLKHKVAFTRKSTSRECGVADAVPDERSTVWGVVYDIPEVEFARLDRNENYQPGRPAARNSYLREQRHVYRDGNEDDPVLAWTYLANPQPNPPLPNKTYKKLIVDGARHWHLPPAYIVKLKRIKVQK